MSDRWNYTTTTPEAEAWRLKMRAESEAVWKTIADMDRRLDILDERIAALYGAPLLHQTPSKRAKIE